MELNFEGGVIWQIDKKGNMYGYYVLNPKEDEEKGEMKNFKLTTDNKIEYLNKMVYAVTNEGNYITTACGMSYPQAASADGKVIVGGGVTTVFGSMVNTPEVLYDPNYVDGIDGITSENKLGVDYRSCGTLFVDGQYNSAELYSVSGALLDSGKQGKVFSLANRANGTYIVKVNTGEGVKSFKVVK